jgi:molybdate transport system substrate-binding protein
MVWNIMRAKVLSFALVLLLLTPALPAVQARESQTLTVFAAASLTDAFGDIATGFEAAHPGVKVVFNFGGSSTLAAQLAEGAPADVFASANGKQMGVARSAGRVVDPVHVFAQNRLVIAVPADNPAHIQSLRDLARPGLLLVVAAPDVPVRDYTDRMLAQLAAVPAYGPAYRQAVMANIVSEEDNVRLVVAKVALGEADAGIVYQSDITPDVARDVTAILIPSAYNTLAAYPIAVTNDTPHPDLAWAFVEYVLSADGQAALAHWGFIPVPASTASVP